MYTTCLFCHASLGTSDLVPSFPVGRRLAFDPGRGRLWVVCTRCGRWNLSPIEERWEAIEDCERAFRGTRLRMSTDNVGLARARAGVELVRIGPALLPEIASWRYGVRLERHLPRPADQGFVARGRHVLVSRTASAIAGYAAASGLSDETMLRMLTLSRSGAVLLRAGDGAGRTMTVRYRHLRNAGLIRPDHDGTWRLRLEHDRGVDVVAEGAALRIAGKLLAVLNFAAGSTAEVEYAIAKLDAAGDPDGYFTRVAEITMRTSWGRLPNAIGSGAEAPQIRRGLAQHLALQLANRSFWARGGTGSEAETPLFRVPAVDRLALEMAANEDLERRALAGELEQLRRAWQEAEEIAAIADDLLTPGLLDEFRERYRARA